MDQDIKSRALLYDLIVRLCRLCQGMDRVLDNKLGNLRTQLDKNVAVSTLEPELEQANMLLKKTVETRDLHSKTLLNTIVEFGSALQKQNGIPPDLRRDLRSFMAEEEPYGSFENQQRLIKLVNFYHQSLIYKPESGVGLLNPLSASKEQSDLIIQQLHKQRCDELQQLISEMELNVEQGDKLQGLRKQLLEGIAPEELSGLCLNVIKLICAGAAHERRASQEFLFSLNESLSQFYLTFSQSVADSKALNDEQNTINLALKTELANISSDVSSSKPLDELKKSITVHLSQMQDCIRKKEVVEGSEVVWFEQLQLMEKRLAVMKDETAEYKKQLTIQQQKLYLDSLTQVHNRAALDERLELEFKRWQRYEHSLCLAVVDIDNFKQINDTYGHLAGDKALKVIARALQKSIRETDFIARFGGEEFVLLLPNLDAAQLLVPLNKLRQKVKKIPFKFKDAKVSISISIGATLFKQGDQPLDAFERADKALYEAKNSGRDCTKVDL